MKDLTVLISASGSPSIPGIIACFKNNGERKIRVVGVDMSDEPSARYMVDAFYQVPAATHPDYCNILLDICKKEHVDIYFPGVSAEVSALVKRWDDFKRIGVTLSVSNSNSVDVANNKLKTYQMLAEAGIPVPEYYPVHTVNDFVEGCKYMGYPQKPVCLKIVNGSGSRGVRIIDANKSRYQLFAHEKPNSFYTSYDDMLSILKEVDVLDELMLVEFMPGNEYTVDLLAHKSPSGTETTPEKSRLLPQIPGFLYSFFSFRFYEKVSTSSSNPVFLRLGGAAFFLSFAAPSSCRLMYKPCTTANMIIVENSELPP